MARFTLDPKAPPALTPAEQARLDAMDDTAITAAAKADPDNPPLTTAELARMAAARRVQGVRAGTGLSQAAFAKAYRINLARLRDLEQGRTQADSALMAYLALIDHEPDLVRRTLESAA